MIYELQKALLDMPQADVETNHYFCDGVYCREMIMKADTCIVGAKHKTSFFLTLSQGECIIIDGDEEILMQAPMTVISKIGAKRAIYALKDCVLSSFHKTDKTDVELIEKEIIEPEGLRIANNPKKVIV